MAKYLDIQLSPIALNYSCAPSVKLLNSLHAAGPACARFVPSCLSSNVFPDTSVRLLIDGFDELTRPATFLFICFLVVISSGAACFVFCPLLLHLPASTC